MSAQPGPVVITCAVTGSAPTRERNFAVPVTPAEIAHSAIEAADAGAAMVHIHVRDPESGKASGDPSLYWEVASRIHDSGRDVIVNISTGFGGFFNPGTDDPGVAGEGSNIMLPLPRIQHVLDMKPEVCSLDVGTANFGDRVFMNTAPHLRSMSQAISEAGVKPEIEVFEAGHILFARHLIERGLLRSPPHFQLCLGVSWCMPATSEAMAFMVSLLPDDATWSVFGLGSSQFPTVREGVRQGGHVRVGLEDNLYLERGVLAPSNAALVDKAVSIVRDEGRREATAAEARAILGLKSAC
ncbi:3-keto-5-aminohexanoate cleavage enzyme [Tsuneonella dongtanensis]|uniref:3-keto-5-aminohexanoate cleavage enzyme n=1 Tax=Tsuneonella dongtanensis TaxID=692370 RepID=A0A1B2AC16_9SPHN|nr:3-keto-5-aminohexanoate cleavage protein [Tsuneonella dongtanensis]ANY19595.1 3-keto-5-aminohexanoate cleavage enzyme [Tsuneonella dongtanensis]